MGLVNQMFAGIPILGQVSREPGDMIPYPSHVTITDGDAAYDTMAKVLAIIGALAAGSDWVKIWEMTVGAQMMMRWGSGRPDQPQNQGYMWFCSIDTNVDFQHGVLRLAQARARDRQIKTVQEFDDSRLHGTTVTSMALATPVNKNEMIALPEQRHVPKVGEDSLLQLWYRCIAPATAEDDVAFSIPVTIWQRQ